MEKIDEREIEGELKEEINGSPKEGNIERDNKKEIKGCDEGGEL